MLAHTLAVIPARAGSKRVLGKNERHLGGRPLLEWTVLTAIESGCFDAVLVSTDSERLAAIGRGAGAIVPWLRPTELATDTATSVSVCQHALDAYERDFVSVSALVLLQPTSPFRRVSTIRSAMDIYRLSSGESVVSVSPANIHPSWYRTVDSEGILRCYPGISDDTARSGPLAEAWYLNGLIYVAAPKVVRSGSLYGAQSRALPVLDRIESIDIDTEFDWAIAEAALPKVRARSESDG